VTTAITTRKSLTAIRAAMEAAAAVEASPAMETAAVPAAEVNCGLGCRDATDRQARRYDNAPKGTRDP
jgi:hypothetical protein